MHEWRRVGHHVVGTFEIADFDQARRLAKRLDSRQKQLVFGRLAAEEQVDRNLPAAIFPPGPEAPGPFTFELGDQLVLVIKAHDTPEVPDLAPSHGTAPDSKMRRMEPPMLKWRTSV